MPMPSENSSEIAGHDVPRIRASDLQVSIGRNIRRSHADHRDPHRTEIFADDFQRIEQGGEQHRSGTLLIVMPHGEWNRHDGLLQERESTSASAMSSRLMPPNEGSSSFTVRTISSGSLVPRQIGNRIHSRPDT